MATRPKSSLIGPIKFAGRFFFLWNGVLFTTLMLVIVFSLFIGPRMDKQFPNLRESKPGITLMIFGIPLLNACIAFVITYYFFQRAYSRLAVAVSPDLPVKVPQREMWKSWATTYWVAPVIIISTIAGFGFARLQLTHRQLGVTAYPIMVFLTSFPVYLRLKYLARQERLQKNMSGE